MTVSNVVHDRPGVSDDVRRRVQEAIVATGYRPNPSAQALKSGRTGVIGLAVPSLGAAYFGQLAVRVGAVAAARGYRLAVEQTGARVAGEVEAIATSRRTALDGLILSVVDADPSDLRGYAADTPLVLLGERAPDREIDHVSMPNDVGAEAATRHLWTQGSRRIAFMGPEASDRPDGLARRLAGYESAVADLGQSPVRIAAPTLSMEAGRAAARALPAGVDGVVAATDTLALGVLRGLADAGRTVPGQVRVVGFDDLDESPYAVPSLSSVRPDHDWMAELAVATLVERIEGRAGPAVAHVAPFVLVERESSG
ncbi:LacI family transcriptional regulator [Serinibacter arcticus]|uniref:LacI family transcriptional regulator n=2 Tax=Serinibacter arcticus TaxID=1655435 RepID=A0A2U2A033_9MICO|nr:LacI family transcriptional regulator [Serinibacter arcticus]